MPILYVSIANKNGSRLVRMALFTTPIFDYSRWAVAQNKLIGEGRQTSFA